MIPIWDFLFEANSLKLLTHLPVSFVHSLKYVILSANSIAFITYLYRKRRHQKVSFSRVITPWGHASLNPQSLPFYFLWLCKFLDITTSGYCHEWSFTLLIPAPRRLRQKVPEFKDSLGYIARLCLKKEKKYCFNGLDLTLPSHSFFCELYFNSTITDHTSNNCDLILNNKLSLTITDALQNK